jgi:hypothetical protein
VPIILTRCVAEIEKRGLDDPGLYRVSGRMAAIKKLREAFIDDPRAAAVCVQLPILSDTKNSCVSMRALLTVSKRTHSFSSIPSSWICPCHTHTPSGRHRCGTQHQLDRFVDQALLPRPPRASVHVSSVPVFHGGHQSLPLGRCAPTFLCRCLLRHAQAQLRDGYGFIRPGSICRFSFATCSFSSSTCSK